MSADKRSDDFGAPGSIPGRSEERFGIRPDDPSPDDPIERLGKRIGRTISYLLAAALVIYLWYTYMRG
jgi:hypothetical protein